jgi:tRNA acetyltransferase TAN1
MVKSDLALIENAAVEIAVERIVPEEAFAVRCRNRHSPLDSQEVERILGATIVKTIGCRVNLKNPDKVVRVEILGGRTGVSVLGSGDVLKKVVVY